MKTDCKRICLWSGPRNVSTALMYSFAQREDTQVYDEPLYGFYLSNSEAASYHPGSDEVMSSMECDGNKVVEHMMGPQRKDVVFFKHMTHHLLDLDRSFLSDVHNVILTRDPQDMIPSFAKVIDKPNLKDLGYAQHLDLLDYFAERSIQPIVLDSKRLLDKPEAVLTKLCTRIGIDFDPAMLHWEPGARKEDGVWARYWYENVHRSSGFQKYRKKEEQFPVQLEALLQECLPIYNKLLDLSI